MNFSHFEAQTHLAAIVDSSDDAIISKDLKGNIISWNKSAERIFGYTSAEAVGRHITLIIPSERLPEEDKILTTLKNGKRIEHFETMRRHKDGHLVPISLTVSPIYDSGGKIIGASKISRDISERIDAANQLEELSRKKDDFMANMSHELRTPMNAVIGLSNLLIRSKNLPEKERKFVETLKISADNLMDLINDLLDFSKIESGNIEFESVDFNLAEQVEKAASVIGVKAREKHLGLSIDYAPTLPRHFMGDPLRIHQVVMNLLSNAVKFTEKGSIKIALSGKPDGRDATQLSIRVSDTGIGIAEDKISVIFDKFIQADSSITRRYGGSGLGMAITKSLVEKMGGTIAVESELGVGTTFHITLPLEHSARQMPMESFSAEEVPAIQQAHKHVLLVEDYEPNVMVATEMLEHLGYQYDVAENGFAALRNYAQGAYNVILMDIQMHELDGLEATRRIRKMEAAKNLPYTPIIAMTAHVMEQDKQKCIDAGMDDFISKPFDPAELERKLAHHIRHNKGLSAVV